MLARRLPRVSRPHPLITSPHSFAARQCFCSSARGGGVVVPPSLISTVPRDSGVVEQGLISGLQLFPDAITESEERILVDQLDPLLSPKEYQFRHWDNVIRGYRETEISKFKFPKEVQAIFERLEINFMGPALGIERPQSISHMSASRLAAMGGSMPNDEDEHDGQDEQQQRPSHPFTNVVPVLPQVHVLDLHKDGEILGHLDSVKFTGSMVAGLSLLSSSIMRFEKEQDSGGDHGAVELLLKPRSLYILTDKARYEWIHGILGGTHQFDGQSVERDRRISIMFRNFLP